MRIALVCTGSIEPCEDCKFQSIHSFFSRTYRCKVFHFKELDSLVDIVKEGFKFEGVIVSTPAINLAIINTVQYLQQMYLLRIFLIVDEIGSKGIPVHIPSNHIYIRGSERSGYSEELFSRLRCWFDEGKNLKTVRTKQTKNISLNLHSKSLKVGDVVVELTCKEFDLLDLLMECQGQFIPTEKILNRLWDCYTSPEIVRQYVYKLRHKIEITAGRNDIILFRRGIGYSINL